MSKSPLLVWEPRYPPDVFRQKVEEHIDKCKKQIESFNHSLEHLSMLVDDPTGSIKDKIKEKREEYRRSMMESLRELFILDHPDRPYERGSQGRMILCDEDEMFIRMKHL